MNSKHRDADVIVVGGGHAGCEAAAASARAGARTLLITGDIAALGRMSCNPAIGGIAKGHLVREIDALGGVMGVVTDKTAIQYRVLNRSKGTAVWSPRAQCDRYLYSKEMRLLMESYPGIELLGGMVKAVEVEDNRISCVVLEDGSKLRAGAIILTCGTFLNGLMHCGDSKEKGGRVGELPVVGLTQSLADLGFDAGRLKTGTPPRLSGKTIDYSRTVRQDGDIEPIFFHWESKSPPLEQLSCWITHTNEAVHEALKAGLDRSPLYNGSIEGRGPRYCPSIEDKIVRFADKEAHTIFLEPEGLTTDDVYPNGFSTSLPADVQLKAIRHIPGLENVELTRPGYAVEYDFFPPHQLFSTLETKLVKGLFFAGQINGTSGYEEAAAQGLMAGVNAAQVALETGNIFRLGREEAYIGVLIDDLITRGTDEPYRMFTSRAEYRLHLRLDNAGARLTAKAFPFGLIKDNQIDYLENLENNLVKFIAYLTEEKGSIGDGQVTPLTDLLRRPEVTLMELIKDRQSSTQLMAEVNETGAELVRRVEAEVKYEGYLRRQESRVQDMKRNRARAIPNAFDFEKVRGISSEGLEKLRMIKPSDIGQAGSIPGVTQSDLAVLLVHLKKYGA